MTASVCFASVLIFVASGVVIMNVLSFLVVKLLVVLVSLDVN